MTHRKICPKEWLFAKITTNSGEIFYRKVRKLNQYYYGVSIPSTIKSDFKVEKFDSFSFPITFSVSIIKESESYFYIIIPSEIVKLLNLKEGDIISYNLGNQSFIGKLRKGCSSLKLTIPKSTKQDSLENKITINDKLKFKNTPNRIILHHIKEELCFELRSLLPKSTTRDNINFKTLELGNDKLIVGAEFKHVKGTSFKYIVFPRYVNAKKIALFFGLMHSDGSKKFAYQEVYNKYIFSPVLNFTNGDPYVIDLFLHLFEELFEINRENFSINIKYPLELDAKKEERLKKFWQRITRCEPTIYRDSKRLNRWCPLGIVNAGIYEILLAEIIISSLKKFLFWLRNSDSKSLKTNFIDGVLIGDGSPILDKGALRRIMIAVEFRFEGEIYKKILSSLGFKSRNLWPINLTNLPPAYLRKLDIRGDTRFLELLFKSFLFGYFENGKFYGSLEKQYRFVSGALRLTKFINKQKLKIEFSMLKNHLKSYINEVKSFLPIPKFYEEMINEK